MRRRRGWNGTDRRQALRARGSLQDRGESDRDRVLEVSAISGRQRKALVVHLGPAMFWAEHPTRVDLPTAELGGGDGLNSDEWCVAVSDRWIGPNVAPTSHLRTTRGVGYAAQAGRGGSRGRAACDCKDRYQEDDPKWGAAGTNASIGEGRSTRWTLSNADHRSP